VQNIENEYVLLFFMNIYNEYIHIIILILKIISDVLYFLTIGEIIVKKCSIVRLIIENARVGG
jgi:hypothetical protein